MFLLTLFSFVLCVVSFVDSQIVTETFVSDSNAVSVLGLSDIHDEPASVCFTGTRNDWSDAEARVVCRRLEYMDGKAVLLREEDLGEGSGSSVVVVSDFDCNGDESSLAECQHGFTFMTDAGCGTNHYAGVNCFSTDCGGTFTSTSGNLSSPNYPDRYPSGSNCTYVIHVPSTNTIRLEFEIADFEYGVDYLQFGKGTDTSNEADSHHVTGGITPDPFELMVNSMWLRFISDESVNDFGFSLRYEAYASPPCSGYFTNDTGTFTSPLFPNPYPSYSNCTYVIDIPDAEHITVHFDTFRIEYGGYDNLYYGKGTDPSIAKRLGTLTGSRFRPDPLEIPGSSAWFIFESDASTSYNGFEIRWETVTEAPTIEITDIAIVDTNGTDSTQGYARLRGLAGEHWVEICYDHESGSWGPAEATIVCKSLGYDSGVPLRIPGGLQYSWVLYNFQCGDDALSINECTWDPSVHNTSGCGMNDYAGVYCSNQPCGETYSSPTGTLLSPNFPDKYPPFSNCTYHIDFQEATSLTFVFHTFRLGQRGDEDSLLFYAENPDVGTPPSGRVSGLGQPRPLVFYTNSVWFRFTSDQNEAFDGFNITWEASVNDCDVVFTSTKGNFSSPSFPNDYPHLAYCTYQFNIPGASSITFKVERFNTRRDQDFLYMGNDTILTTGSATNSYSGWDVPTSLTVEGGYLWFIFTSDVEGSAGGFNITWDAFVESGDICGKTFTSPIGTITSPGYPGRYFSDLDCIFIINVPEADILRIEFQELDLEFNYDFLYVGEGTDYNKEANASLTGTFVPEHIDIFTSSIWFRFVTDGAVNYDGFSFTWEALDAQYCHGNYSQPYGSFTSPEYPSPYPLLSSCSYVIAVEGASHITISFTEFDLEYGYDMLYFGIGTDPSIERAIGSFTGYFTPPEFSFPTSSMWFIFESDASGSGLGFELLWDTKTEAPESVITDVEINGHDMYGYVTVDFVEELSLHDWAHICFDDDHHTWGDIEASAICRYKGYEYGTAMAFDTSNIYDNSWILTNFVCSAESSSVYDCTYDTLMHSMDGCGSQRYAGVQCSNTPCGGTYTTPTGVILSPNYPDRYPSKSYCIFVINVPGATSLNFTFNEFQLETTHDTLQFYASNAASTVNVRYEELTGSGSFPSMAFQTGSLWLHFTTDETAEYAGFNISWKAAYDQCIKTYSEASGTFRSHGYPQNYRHLANCTYLFNITNATRIRFAKVDFETEWEYDFVVFGNYDQNQTKIEVERFSGAYFGVPQTFTIIGDLVWVHFTSDIAINDFGFEFSWHALYENESGTNNICGQTFTSTTGTISSPGYPDRYPSNFNCTFVINIPNADGIKITFLEFDLEPFYDFLYYGVGTQYSENQREEMSGNIATFQVELLSNSLWGRFTTDDNLNYYGFLFTWEAFNTTSCDENYTRPSGIISSPNYPLPYPGFSYCTYVINVEGARHLSVTFNDFDVEYRHDFLHYGIGTEPLVDRALGHFTGYYPPSDFSLPTSTLWFVFESNGAGNEFGFELSWDTTSEAPEKEINGVRINSNDCGDVCMLGYVTIDHIEELHPHNWAHVCFDDDGHTWSDIDARAICLNEGFEDGTAVAFDEWDGNGWILTNFVCSPGASSVYDCTYDSVNYNIDGCATRRYAGVQCTNTACGGSYFSSNGFILSPNYPSKYPSGADCTYVINVPGAISLNFTFNEFRVETGHDPLRFYASDPANDENDYEELSGLGRSRPLVFQTGSLWLKFTSDFSVEYAGFNISWNASYDKCINTSTDVRGSFSSPSYPDNYPHLADCTYLFNIPDAIGISFFRREFDTEENHDFVFFGNSSEIRDDKAIESFSGPYYDIPAVVRIHGNFAWVHFTSDISIGGFGFQFEWEAILETTACGQTFKTRTGQIDSPNYPDRYPSNLYCTYLINVPGANRITIEFQAFDLEYDFDNLTFGIYNNSAAENDVHLLTGFIIPDPIELVTDNVWFEFATDESIADTGFSFTYEALDVPDCSGRFTTSTGTISSPNYPNAYPGYANCTYILDIHDASHITVKFDFLELENGADVLYCGLGSAPSLNNAEQRFTGYTTPASLSFSSSKAWCIFLSDGNGRDKGFSLSWDTITDAPDSEITDVRVFDKSGLEGQAGYVALLGLARNDWVGVCYEGDISTWSDIEAKLVCNLRGYDGGKAVNLGSDVLNDEEWSIRDLYCHPDATDLNKCDRSDVVNGGCGTMGYAGVHCANEPCGGTFTNPSGTIQSPNYPLRYPNLSNCTYVIRVPHATRLTIEFSNFQLEHDHDKLEYYQTDPDVNTGHVGVLTGLGRQAPIMFYTNTLWFRFTSDLSVAYEGFSLSYRVSYESCSKIFTAVSGSVSSPNFPANYPHMTNCSYIFEIPKATNIHFFIAPFDTEDGPDGLYYGSGRDVDLSTAEYLTGNKEAFIVEALSDSFWFHFVSDLTISGRGFTMNWKAIIEATGTTKPDSPTTTMKPSVANEVKPTGSSNIGNQSYQISPYHQRALVAGYVIAAVFIIIVIVLGAYIVFARRNSGDGNIMFRTSSTRSSGSNVIDHHNAAFDASEDTIITKTDT